MCGIAGYKNLTNKQEQIQEQLLHAMQQSIVHRGPDGHGIWKSDIYQIGFAHRRLSIIDLSDAGSQPMTDEYQSIVICFNGEIYNYKKLRAKLEARGHLFRSKTDTEVLVHGYKEWGIAFLEKLEGMLAGSRPNRHQTIIFFNTIWLPKFCI